MVLAMGGGGGSSGGSGGSGDGGGSETHGGWQQSEFSIGNNDQSLIFFGILDSAIS